MVLEGTEPYTKWFWVRLLWYRATPWVSISTSVEKRDDCLHPAGWSGTRVMSLWATSTWRALGRRIQSRCWGLPLWSKALTSSHEASTWPQKWGSSCPLLHRSWPPPWRRSLGSTWRLEGFGGLIGRSDLVDSQCCTEFPERKPPWNVLHQENRPFGGSHLGYRDSGGLVAVDTGVAVDRKPIMLASFGTHCGRTIYIGRHVRGWS